MQNKPAAASDRGPLLKPSCLPQPTPRGRLWKWYGRAILFLIRPVIDAYDDRQSSDGVRYLDVWLSPRRVRALPGAVLSATASAPQRSSEGVLDTERPESRRSL
jgi:hypothetical protein